MSSAALHRIRDKPPEAPLLAARDAARAALALLALSLERAHGWKDVAIIER